MAFKIYTKTGDKGKTSLIGGSRVDKSDLRVQAYGDIDETKSHIGLLHDLTNDKEIKESLKEIMINLFVAESMVASDSDSSLKKMPHLNDENITFLEKKIDKMNEVLKPLSSFILPAGNQLISQTHIARTVCRRAERKSIIAIKENQQLEIVIKYLNRLSDFLFVLSRYFAHIYDIEEVKWES